MIQVHLWGGLRPLADGVRSIELDARSIGELFQQLEARYPQFDEAIQETVAVAINGTVYRDSWQQPLPEQGEVYLLPRLEGG